MKLAAMGLCTATALAVAGAALGAARSGPKIDPKAERLLREMTDHLAGIESTSLMPDRRASSRGAP
jgi:hypothetical protein